MSMKALVIGEPGEASVQDVPRPKLRNEFIKIKIVAVALNPTDWKHIDYFGDKGAILGGDVAGVVTEVGSGVTSKISKGDHVYGMTHGGNISNHEDGGFAEYAVLKDGVFAKVSTSFEEAAALPVGILATGQGLYQSLELPRPDSPAKEPFPVLIYGGSTATGQIAIQFAKLSGLTVITTASRHNFDLVKQLGADAVFDYHDKDCAIKIREYTKDNLHYVFDCVSEGNSIQINADSLATKAPDSGLHYSSLLPVEEFPRKDVKNRSTLGYTAFGEAFHKFGMDIPAIPEHREFASNFFRMAAGLVAAGKIKPQAIDHRKGSLQDILGALQEMRQGNVSGKKIVYTIGSP